MINNYKTYLLAWNPDLYPWSNFPKDLEIFKQYGNVVKKWSCGNTKSINPGDRIFLIRRGSDGMRGIIGSGYATSSFFTDDHWDGTPGKKAKFIDVDFDVLVEPSHDDFINYDELTSDPILKLQEWSTISAGISILPEVSKELERRWFESTARQFTDLSKSQEFIEGRLIEIISKKYERNAHARRECLLRFGYKCIVCKFDFEEIYGEIGREFIHVHHKKAISSFGKEHKINPVDDLVPVCPNCHAMIHRKIPEYSVEEIMETLSKQKK